MAVTHLLDTNVISEIAAPRPDPRVQRMWNVHRGRMALSAITWHELLYGLNRLPASHRKRGTQQFLFGLVQALLPILPYDERSAEWHARERARLIALGRTPPFADGQIAAIAAANHLVLVTRNTADFDDFDGLTLENWFEAAP